jgi:hypothetical protein
MCLLASGHASSELAVDMIGHIQWAGIPHTYPPQQVSAGTLILMWVTTHELWVRVQILTRNKRLPIAFFFMCLLASGHASSELAVHMIGHIQWARIPRTYPPPQQVSAGPLILMWVTTHKLWVRVQILTLNKRLPIAFSCVGWRLVTLVRS